MMELTFNRPPQDFATGGAAVDQRRQPDQCCRCLALFMMTIDNGSITRNEGSPPLALRCSSGRARDVPLRDVPEPVSITAPPSGYANLPSMLNESQPGCGASEAL